MAKRKYKLKQRAVQQEETRERIVDAAMALHEEIGPAATTISALAERAGVQRLTVYRHFASEQEILKACSSKWMRLHPPPDPSGFDSVAAPDRTHAVLESLYGYYRDTQEMWTSLNRDRGRLDVLDAPMGEFDEYLAEVVAVLLASTPARRSKRLRATISHAVRFSTWRSLDSEGMSPRSMATLVDGWIAAA